MMNEESYMMALSFGGHLLKNFFYKFTGFTMKGFLELAKSNPFFSPFQTAKCSGSELPALPKPSLVPSRSIAAAATSGNQ